MDINLHCTYSKILEAVRIQKWFPLNCHFCNYKPKHVDDYERHVAKLHPRRPAYPGPTPENVARAIYIVESIERELKLVKAERAATAKAAKLSTA